MAEIIDIKELLAGVFDYTPTTWRDKVNDPEGDNSHPGVKFTARRGNNLEQGADFAHERLNDIVAFLVNFDRTQKNLRFEFLLLKASITSGLTSNILVDNFESLLGINLIVGSHDAGLQKIYIP